MPSSPSNAFGPWLRARRKALDLTQFDLAESVGCAEDTIQRIEAGTRRPSKQVAALMAERLAIPTPGRLAFTEFARLGNFPAGLDPRLLEPVPPSNNLPASLTPLIGREREVQDAKQLLRGRARLLVLTGPPGIGKTRLATEVATGLLPDFPDGVFFVELAPIHDPERVLEAVAGSLGLRDLRARAPTAALLEYLRDKRLMLVLDNFEQVVEAAPLLVELLTGSPRLRILVTSRTLLAVRGEHQLPVPLLARPDLQALPTPAELARSPAVALFVERAKAVQPDFTLDPENAAAVVGICVRLDGLPLALELAAARTPMLPPVALLATLQGRQALATGGLRDLPPRQQTLRAAIAWSYDLLGPEQQTLFARLGVFAGGTTAAAVAAVCDAKEDWPSGAAARLTVLQDHSLIQRQPLSRSARAAEERWALLETIREYAVERLQEAGEWDTVARRHSEYYLALVEAAASQFSGPGQQAWLDRLERDHDNLRAALERALGQGDTQLALRLSGAAWRFWKIHGHLSEGRRWLEAALALDPEAVSAARATALRGAGILVRSQGDYARAASLHTESLALWRMLDDRRGVADAINDLGVVVHYQGDTARAAALYEESLALRRTLGDQKGVSSSLCNLGLIALYKGDLERALALFSEGVSVVRAVGDTEGVATSLYNLGIAVMNLPDLERAAEHFAESLVLLEKMGNREMKGLVLQKLGEIALSRHDAARAITLFREAEALARELGDPATLAYALGNQGAAALMAGDHRRAAAYFRQSLRVALDLDDHAKIGNALYGLAEATLAGRGPAEARSAARWCAAAEAQYAAAGVPEQSRQPQQERTLAAVHAQLDAAAFAAAWATGQAMSGRQAIAEALTQPG